MKTSSGFGGTSWALRAGDFGSWDSGSAQYLGLRMDCHMDAERKADKRIVVTQPL